jgi:HEAT repeats/Putative zinc-finger
MTCDDAIKAMRFFLYGEMEFDEEEGLQAHLDNCESCQDALTRQRSLRSALDARELEVSAFLLRRNRQLLGERLAAESDHRHGGAFGSLAHLFSGWDWMPRFVRPAGAVALVAIGFFAAQVTPGGRGMFQSAGLVDPNTFHVRYVEPADNGRIQIVVDETRSRVISGRLDDEPIRKLLISATKDPSDPGLRGESVEILKHQTESGEIRSALLSSLQHDSNAGVRLKAIEALKPYAAHPEVRKALGDVLLHDDNPGVRTQAIDLLTQNNREDQLVGVLQELMRKEQNSYVRDRCERVLKERKASVETY